MAANRKIKCTHPDYLEAELEYDIDGFWTGLDAPPIYKTSKTWGGNFSGRPKLSDQIFPILQSTLALKKPQRITKLITGLRNFYRFLDGYELWCDEMGSSTSYSKVISLSNITPHHLACWITPFPKAKWKASGQSDYAQIAQIIVIARTAYELPKIWIPSHPISDLIKHADFPDEEVGRILIFELAQKASEIWNRWEHADILAAEGRNLLSSDIACKLKTDAWTYGNVTEADLHTTYRALASLNEERPPSDKEFKKALGCKHNRFPGWWPVHSDTHPKAEQRIPVSHLTRGLYPDISDCVLFALLLIARTGWNPAVALSLDATLNENWCAQYSPKLVWMFAFKTRSNTWQDTLSWVNKRTGPYQIVMRLMARTAPLRKAIKENSSLCTLSVLASRSPWLYARDREVERIPIGVLTEDSAQLNLILTKIVNEYNQNTNEKPLPSVTPTDFRHIFAGAIFKKTGYSLVLTQWALGHKSSRTTFKYLRSRAFREEAERSKNLLVVAIFDQIEVHRKIDLTLLRAQMDGIEVTREQIARLEAARKNRTYSGAGCSAPKNPPIFIDPNNPRDGATNCNQGHRCVACPRARVFNDSLPELARRLAELEWQQNHISAVSFDSSSSKFDLDILRATLKQWTNSEVLAHVKIWNERIKLGTHIPVLFGGER